MLMILARLVRSESFWAVVKVRSPHTGPEVSYPRCGWGGRRCASPLSGRPSQLHVKRQEPHGIKSARPSARG